MRDPQVDRIWRVGNIYVIVDIVRDGLVLCRKDHGDGRFMMYGYTLTVDEFWAQVEKHGATLCEEVGRD